MDKDSWTLRPMSGLMSVLETILETWTRWGPGARLGETQLPSLLVSVAYCALVTSFTAATSTPTTAALQESDRGLGRLFSLGTARTGRTCSALYKRESEQNGGSASGPSSEQRIFKPLLRLIRRKIQGGHRELRINFRTEKMKGLAGIPDKIRLTRVKA
jgi:hypothetical protein